MQIGYIGLGAMGSALAGRFLPTHQLVVWDLNGAAVAAFGKHGAKAAPSAAELARQCDVVLLCLPRSADVRQVIFGAGGLAEGLAPGKLVIDQTSGVPGETREIARQLAERGVAMIDAPVSGGVAGAAGGTISIMASGSDADYDRALPALTAISPNVFRCGSRVGDGQAMKLVNNVLSAGCRLATLEVVAMGRKMGLSLAAITDVVNKGSGRNRTSKLMLQKMVDGTPSASSFAMSLMLKDMNQAVALGMEAGAPTPITNVVRGLLQIGVSQLGDQAQLEEVLGLIEGMARTRIADEHKDAPPPAAAADAKEMRVGYVGLGAMGGALTRRLMLSRKMRVYDARPEVVRAFEAEGAIAAPDLPTLARECDVIFVCVPTSAIVREVVFGKGGLAEGLAPGKVIVDQTTGDPTVTREIAAGLEKLGVPLVDAPVSGGPRGAVAGTIAIICGGPAEPFAKVRPILAGISPNVVYCGQTGNGHVAKLIQNTVASCNRLLTYEAAALGVKYGLTLADMATVINKSTGWSGASERILPTLSEGKATADFQLALMAKDLRLAARMAIDCGAPMLIANAVRSYFEAGANEFGGTANLDDMRHVVEAMAGIEFKGA
ncbi:NAD(P)-dependent oxidoreductase [Rhodoferax sediminis]|uniref:NAD(P)-dependent oxidoreductase n=1 Tax=Rhodoferax sediminis TaxID=2509614 RepID=A0A515DDU5_9BURK|nr:NAD(P)-dependent oxidoreductase [Rhodoferax sediminis]QDL38591.1 NAD(P)-dependent oxidoreductase [Rhodoferax sediminis]